MNESSPSNLMRLFLRWMALRRGRMGGLLWGLEPLLSKLLRLSWDGDACTVILCWKSEAEEDEEQMTKADSQQNKEYEKLNIKKKGFR